MSLDDLLAYVAQVITDFLNSIQGGINQAVGLVQNYLNEVINAIGGRLADLIANIAPIVTTVVNGIVNSLSGVVSSIIDSVNGILQSLQNTIAQVVEQIGTVVSNLWAALQNSFQTIVQSVSDLVEEIKTNITAVFQGIVDYFKNLVTGVITEIQTFFGNLWDQIKAGLSSLWATIQEGFGVVVNAVSSLWQQVVTAIQNSWQDLITGAESAFAQVKGALDDVASTFNQGFQAVTDGVSQAISDASQPIEEAWKTFNDYLTAILDPEAYADVQAAIAEAVAPGTYNIQSSEGFQRFYQAMIPKNPTAAVLFVLIFGVFVAKETFHGVVSANSDVLLQQFSLAHPWRLLEASEAREAYRRGNLGQAETLDTIRAAGYTAEDATRIISNSEAPPQVAELLDMMLRGMIGAAEVKTALNVHGIRDPWASNLIALAQEIPPIDDILRMARRLVFDPSVVSQFQLMDDFQGVVTQWLTKKGLSQEWINAYWAAHWDLPSVTQGFEMYQRGEIGQEQLDLLFRDAGMAPGWRAHLQAIAYHPFTRVDIRRMNKVGVLPDSDLPKAYQNIGYSPANAQQLADFTIKLNAGTKAKGDANLGNLTRSSILQFYQDGLITSEKANALLTGIGILPEAAALYIANTDALTHAADRKAHVAAIIEDLKAGKINFATAQSQLSGLALTPTETERATAQLERASTALLKIPDVTQLNDLYKHGVIKDDAYLAALTAHGFSADWAGKLLAAEKAKLASTKAKP